MQVISRRKDNQWRQTLKRFRCWNQQTNIFKVGIIILIHEVKENTPIMNEKVGKQIIKKEKFQN